MAIIIGKSSNESLIGTSKFDSIDGGAGNDTLRGGGGNDLLTGGLGNDLFIFENSAIANGVDTITDFTGWNGTSGDTLDLSLALSLFTSKSRLSDFITIRSDGSRATVTIDTDGLGTKFSPTTFAFLEGIKGGETIRVKIGTTFLLIPVPVSNFPPTLVDAGATLAFTEDGSATAIDASLTLGDANNTQLTGATISISAGYVATEDVLAFTNANGITGSWNSSTGVLTLSGTATLANYEAALESITYANTNTGNPSTTNRTVTWSVTDGTASTTATSTITVTARNDAPVLNTASSPVLTAIIEDVLNASNTGTTVAAMVVDSSITDADVASGSTAAEAIYVSAVDNTNGTWQYKVGAGSWTAFDFATNTGKGLLLDATDLIRFVPTANWNGTSATITFGAWDKSDSGTAGTYAALTTTGGTSAFSSATDSASITVTAVADPPVIASTVFSATGVTINATSADSLTMNLAVGTTDLSGTFTSGSAFTLSAASPSVLAGTLNVEDTAGASASTGTYLALGTTGNDTMSYTAQTGATALYGFAGADTITGGTGADYIVGGAGADILTGGSGNDTFVYVSGDASAGTFNANGISAGSPGALKPVATTYYTGPEAITDFVLGDTILLGHTTLTADANGTVAANEYLIIQGTYASGVFTVGAGLNTGADSLLIYDSDSGTANAQGAFIVLVGVNNSEEASLNITSGVLSWTVA